MVLDGTAIVVEAGVFDVAPAAAEPNEPLAPKSIPPSVVPSSSALFGVESARASARESIEPRASTPPARVSAPPARVSTPPARVSTPPARVSTPPAHVSTPPAHVSTPPAHVSTPPPRPRASTPLALPELPVWHVAIQGVPVGPFRKSEVAARAAAGDIGRGSLAWREGLADWAAISTIPELAAVVHAPPSAVEPPSAIEPPPAVEPPTRSTRDASATAANDFARAVVPNEPSEAETPAPKEPESGAPVRPSPAIEADSGGRAPSASLEPLDSSDASPPRTDTSNRLRPALVVGAILGVIGVAYLVGKQSGGDVATAPSNTGSTQNPPTAPNDSQRPTDTSPGLAQDAIEDVGEDSYLAELAGVVDAGTRSREGAHDETPAATGTPAADVVDESPLPMPVATRETPRTTTPNGDSFETHVNTTRSAPSGPLDAAQISAVVRANRARAQRCYERAATMSGTAPDVRLSISVRIAPSGIVSNVEVTGNDFGGVVSCVERVVSSWQFPASTTGGQTTFSLVFAGS